MDWKVEASTVALISENQDVDDMLTRTRNQLMRWIHWVPIKVNILVWRIEMDKVPTRVALARRGLSLPYHSYPLCEVAPQTTAYLLVDCGVSEGVWKAIWGWCKLNVAPVSTFEDILKLPSVSGKQNKWYKRIVKGILMVVCWALWITRNKKAFNGYSTRVIEIVALMKSMSFFWLKNRSKFRDLEWKDWFRFDLYML
ncbi:uncharacterized protein LOC110943567 [Helianthus annuus]|uniref:uncharacterized protein LOC110943567 n=1 Tax=Helianthus annuus TaxID=4232 RepID=UPI000B906A23|nr:uncharacterized protein LOC110943567 [Helianthus annuus]